MIDQTRPPVVVVLLSTWNGAAYLDQQLASLAEQTGVVVRVHARDDGSADDTCAILARHAARWPALADIAPDRNLGPAASFLRLLQTAPDDADFYAFCDQDDVWMPEKLARATAALGGEPGPALYCSAVACVSSDLAPLGVPEPYRDTSFQTVLFENIATGCTIVLNPAARDLINRHPPERGVVMHDWWCALVVSALGRLHYDPAPSLFYRQHGGNSVGVSVGRLRQHWNQARRLLCKARSFYAIHAQSAELLRLFGGAMPAPARTRLTRLVASRRSFAARLRYALSAEVKRRRWPDTLMVRALIAAGWY